MIRLNYIGDENKEVSVSFHAAMVTGFNAANGVLQIGCKSTQDGKKATHTWTFQIEIKRIINYQQVQVFLNSLIPSMNIIQAPSKFKNDQQKLF